MKILIISLSLLLSFSAFAACKCNCDPMDRSLCASTTDMDHPCHGMCKGQIGRTACPVAKVFNEMKNKYEWITLCVDRTY